MDPGFRRGDDSPLAMIPAPRFPLLAPALIAGLALGWGLNWPAMKVALAEIPLWTFRAATCVVAGASLLALARLMGNSVTPPPEDWRSLALSSLFNVTVWHVTVAYGLLVVGSGHGSVLAFTMPLWAVLLDRIVFGTPIGTRNAVALGLGVAGVLVLLVRNFGTAENIPVGAALVLLAAIGWAIGTLIQKRRPTRLPTVALAGWQLLIGSLPMVAMVPILEGVHWPQASPLAWVATAYTTFVALVFCYFAWFQIVRLMPINVASISSLLVPVVGVCFGAILLDEPFGWREVLALLLIGSALTLVLIIPGPRRPATVR
jgi:drug/metabolite transporter (DMT)-like permease